MILNLVHFEQAQMMTAIELQRLEKLNVSCKTWLLENVENY